MPIQLSGSGSITGVSTLTSLASLDVTGSVSVGGTLTYDDVTNIDSVGVVTARDGLQVTGGNVGIGITNPTVPLFVQADSPSAIFKLASTTDTSGYHFAFGWADNSLYHRIRTAGGANDGFIIENINSKVSQYFASSGDWNLTTNSSERFRVTSTGAIGIGSNFTAIETAGGGGITLDSGVGGGNIGVFLKSTGYTGNQTKLWQDSANAVSYLESTERPLWIKAGDGAGDYIRMDVAGSERLLITSAGDVGINRSTPSATLDVESASDQTVLRLRNNSGNDTRLLLANKAAGLGEIAYKGDFRFVDNENSDAERIRIASDGTIHVNSPDSASGGRIYAASSKLYLQSGNGRQSVNIADMAAGSTATHEFNSSGNLSLAGGLLASSVNLQNSNTNSWFQTGATYGGTPYVWAAKDSSANVWHSGLQTDGDLLIGGNITGTSRIGLYGSSGNIGLTNVNTSAKLNVSTDISGNYTGWKEKGVASGSMSQASIDSKTPTINDFTYPNSSNGMLIWSTSKIGFAAGGESPQYGTGVQMLFDSAGLMLGGNRAFDRTSSTSTSTNWNLKLNTAGSAVFKGQLEADPVLLDANDSWIKSTYGGISNSTVSSLNNLMIGQNMRGWIGTRDGGSPNNNFYHISTHSGLGYCGTEYCYGAITKFYNNTGATTGNASFTPKERFRITTSGTTVGGSYKFSTNSSTNNELPNPYNIGNVSSNNAAYPHTPGIYFITASSPCDNAWRTLLTSINDSTFVFEGISGDASSKRNFKVIGNPTSPSYGINRLLEDYNHGAWNTGDIEFRLNGTHPNWNLQVRTTSYYNSSNNAGLRIMLFVYY